MHSVAEAPNRPFRRPFKGIFGFQRGIKQIGPIGQQCRQRLMTLRTEREGFAGCAIVLPVGRPNFAHKARLLRRGRPGDVVSPLFPPESATYKRDPMINMEIP